MKDRLLWKKINMRSDSVGKWKVYKVELVGISYFRECYLRWLWWNTARLMDSQDTYVMLDIYAGSEMNVGFWRHTDNFPPLTKLHSLYNRFKVRRNLDVIRNPSGNFFKNSTFSIKIVRSQRSVPQGHLSVQFARICLWAGKLLMK